jgi:hypothetical protein
MPLREHLQQSLFGKAALATAALGGFLLFAGAPQAQAADHRESCERRIAHAEHELGEAIEDHGYYSRQANHWRQKRREAYEHCYGRDYGDREGYYRDQWGNYYYRYNGERDRDSYRNYDRDNRRYDRDRDRY